jgi:antitoxin component YwqK of YwqJK toxin-antitoxin module
MKKIVFLFMCFFTMTGCGEEEKTEPAERVTVMIEKRDNLAYVTGEDLPFTGIFEGYYRNGYKKAEIHFKHGKQDGTAKIWHDNGQLSNEANFRNGKLDGLSTEWLRNGKKSKERFFNEGKLIATME